MEHHQEKKHFLKIGKQVIVYARDGGEHDTMIIRDSFKAAPFNAFGISGRSNVEELSNAIVAFLHANRDCLSALKFGVGQELEKFIDGIVSTQNIVSLSAKEVIHLGGKWRVDFIPQEHPQIALVNVEDGKPTTGVFLFLSSIAKLLRYMNNRFHFYPDKVVAVKDFSNDYFF